MNKVVIQNGRIEGYADGEKIYTAEIVDSCYCLPTHSFCYTVYAYDDSFILFFYQEQGQLFYKDFGELFSYDGTESDFWSNMLFKLLLNEQ